MASPSTVVDRAEELLGEIRTLDSKFRKSCDQILLLNNQIEDLQVRYDRALGSNRRSYRYSIRLRLATLEGVRNMFYEYAHHCANKLEELQNYVFITGREPYSSIEGEWEPVSSEDEGEMSPNPAPPALRSPSHFTSTELTSRFQLRSNASGVANPSPSTGGSTSSGLLASSSRFSSLSQPSTSYTRSSSMPAGDSNPSSSNTASANVLHLSPGFDATPRRRSAYNSSSAYNNDEDEEDNNTPLSSTQTLYSTGSRNIEHSLLEGHSSNSAESITSITSSSNRSSTNSPTAFSGHRISGEEDIITGEDASSPDEPMLGSSVSSTYLPSPIASPSYHPPSAVGRPTSEEPNFSDMEYDSDEDSYGQFSDDL